MSFGAQGALSTTHAWQRDLIGAVALRSPVFSESVVSYSARALRRDFRAGHQYVDGGQGMARRFVASSLGSENKRRTSMCDYGLHAVASRPARSGESSVSTSFCGTSTRSFAAEDEPAVAVRAARHRAGFERDMRYNRKWLLTKSAGFRVAPIPRVSTEAAGVAQCPAVLRRHIVLVNLLSEGQHARVLQLPATRLAKKVGARAELAPVYSRRCSRLRAQRRLDIIFATVSRS
jgi:hypothetical protein